MTNPNPLLEAGTTASSSDAGRQTPDAGRRTPDAGSGKREAGVSDRLAQLVATQREFLIAVAARHGPEGWAEDVIHDAWIKVECGETGSSPAGPTDEGVLEWFLRIVRNEARNRRRTERVRHCEQLDEVRDAAVGHSAVSDPLLEGMVAEVVGEVVGELPSTQREVAELRFREWRLVEIAAQTRRDVGTVKRHWYRARDVLRTALRPYLEL